MAMLKLFQLLAVAMVTRAAPEAEFNGTCYNTPGTLSFSDVNYDADIVRNGKPVTIYCCANNFVDNVIWQHEDHNGKRTLLSPLDKRYVFFQRGQQLTIHKVTTEDSGLFICMASDSTHTISFNFNLTVLECDHAAGKVVPIKIPPKVKYAAVGDIVSLECLGFFGCSMAVFKDVFWLAVYSNGTFEKQLRSDNPLYSVTKISKNDGRVLGSRLTVKVTKQNFTQKYVCYLAVPQPYELHYPVQLKRESTTEIFPLWAWVIVGSFAFIIVMSLLLFLVDRLCGSQIVFWVKTKLNCGWPARKDNVRNDVCLLSSQGSAGFVSENIYDKLLSEGYSVFYHFEEDTAGRLDAYVQMDGLTRSSHVLLYLSSDEEVEKFRQFFVESCVHIHGGSRIIVIHKGPLGEGLKTLKPQIQSKLKIVKSIKWPKNTDKNSREMKNFWCSVRLGLPACRRVEDTNARHASTSSTQPLLEEENQNNLKGNAQGNLNHHV